MVKSMSRKKKVILVIVSFLVMIIFLYHYGFFSRYNYLTAKADIQKGNVRLISEITFWDAYTLVKSLSKEHNVKMEHCEPVFLINNITDSCYAKNSFLYSVKQPQVLITLAVLLVQL